MPRSGWVKPVSDRRLSDLVAVGLLTKVFPAALVDEVIEQTGRTQQRNRSLPARLMAYFAIAMGLHSEGSYEELMSQVTEGLSWAAGLQKSLTPPSKSAIFQARIRLGPEPIEALFARVAGPFGTPNTVGGCLVGKRLVAIDDICLNLQDTPLNAAFFGRPRSKGEEPHSPQARVVALAECGTHAIFHAVVGACTGSEVTLAGELMERLQPGMLLLADRGACSYSLWRKAVGTGADLLWQVTTGLRPEYLQTLGDGSRLALVRPAVDDPSEPITVRVIDCPDGDGSDDPRSCQLFTTVLDPDAAPATELAVAYSRRWQVGLAFDDLKTHHSRSRTVLRSKSPPLVLQEIWGYLCCHYAIRSLMVGQPTHVAAADGRPSVARPLRSTRTN